MGVVPPAGAISWLATCSRAASQDNARGTSSEQAQVMVPSTGLVWSAMSTPSVVPVSSEGLPGMSSIPVVPALLAYLAVRGGEDGPLFRFRDCRALTREVFVDKVTSALSILGYDASTYAGHSFRIGAATTAAEKGIEDSVIKMLGRWESSAYQLYVRSSREMLSSISRRLVQVS